MPTYEYRCPDGHDFEKFVLKMSDAQGELACPTCGKPAARRMSAGASLLFKGSGFYITDYGKDGKKDQRAAAAKSESAKADGAKSDGGKGDGAGSSAATDKNGASGGASSGGSSGAAAGPSSGASSNTGSNTASTPAPSPSPAPKPPKSGPDK